MFDASAVFGWRFWWERRSGAAENAGVENAGVDSKGIATDELSRKSLFARTR